jgi:O-antigen ligase
MNSLIGLSFCILFILFLLKLDRKQFPEASFSLWAPTAWMVLIAGKGLNFYLGGSFGGDLEDGTTLDGMFQVVLLCIALVVLKRRNVKWMAVMKANPWVVLLILYMLISVSWSASEFVSFKRWIRQLVAFVMAVMVATENEPRSALEAVIRRSVYFLIPVSVLLIYFFPHLGTSDVRTGGIDWIGITTHRNVLGRLCCFSLFYLTWKLYRRWKGTEKAVAPEQKVVEVILFMLTLNLFTGPYHTLTYSATSTATFAIGVMTFAGLSWLKNRGRIIGTGTLTGIMVFILIYTVVTPFIGRLSIIDVSSLLNRSETLTGRLYNWLEIIPYAMETPVLGHGFGGEWWSRNPHNSPLTIILNMGFIGLFFFNMFLLTSCSRARKEMLRDFDWGALWTCLLIMGPTHGISERSMVHFGTQWPGVLLFFYVYHKYAEYRPGIKGRIEGDLPCIEITSLQKRNKSFRTKGFDSGYVNSIPETRKRPANV